MGILSGNPKNEPLHYGEVYALWTNLFGIQGMIPAYQTLINHTGDDDLRHLLKDMISSAHSDMKQLQDLLKKNGIAIPPAPPEKPECSIESIPPGARFTDQEVAARVTADIASGLAAYSLAMSQCIREDIAMMFGQLHAKKVQFGATLLQITKDKGWLIPPPLHIVTATQD